MCLAWLSGDLVLIALVPESSGLGSIPGRGHCARHFSITVPLSTQMYK